MLGEVLWQTNRVVPLNCRSDWGQRTCYAHRAGMQGSIDTKLKDPWITAHPPTHPWMASPTNPPMDGATHPPTHEW